MSDTTLQNDDSNIVTFTTVNGTEYIGELTDIDGDIALFKRLVQIVQIQHQGQVGITFYPVGIAANREEPTPLMVSALLTFPIPAAPAFVSKWREFTTGIAMPASQSGLIVG